MSLPVDAARNLVKRLRRWIGGPCPDARAPVGRAVFIDGKPYVLTLMEWHLNRPEHYELEALGSLLARSYVVRAAGGEEMHTVEDALVLAGWLPPLDVVALHGEEPTL